MEIPTNNYRTASDDYFVKRITFSLCGIPEKVLVELSEQEKKDLLGYLTGIEGFLQKIIDLKYSKMKLPKNDYEKVR